MKKLWRVGIVKDSSQPMLGLHGLHVAFNGMPDVEVVAHVDSNPDDIEEKMSFTRAKRHYSHFADMLEKEHPDIVVLCSRHPDDHLPRIQAAAEIGCHIYCEKPLAATVEEADEIIRIAETCKIKIAMAHPARHALPFLTLKKMIQEGEIGTPLSVQGSGKCDHRGGGEDLVVLGTHILDLMQSFFGVPQFVSAEVSVEGRPIIETDRTTTIEPIGPAAGDAISACFGFPGGVRGLFESRKGLFDPASGLPCMGLRIQGTRGSLALAFDDARKQPLLFSPRPYAFQSRAGYEEVATTETRVLPGVEPLDYSLCGQRDIPSAPMFLEANRFAVWDLMRAIEEDRDPLVTVQDARRVQEMIQGIYASHLASGRRIPLPLTERCHPLA